jgi:hypothetical protein
MNGSAKNCTIFGELRNRQTLYEAFFMIVSCVFTCLVNLLTYIGLRFSYLELADLHFLMQNPDVGRRIVSTSCNIGTLHNAIVTNFDWGG